MVTNSCPALEVPQLKRQPCSLHISNIFERLSLANVSYIGILRFSTEAFPTCTFFFGTRSAAERLVGRSTFATRSHACRNESTPTRQGTGNKGNQYLPLIDDEFERREKLLRWTKYRSHVSVGKDCVSIHSGTRRHSFLSHSFWFGDIIIIVFEIYQVLLIYCSNFFINSQN